MLNHISAPMSHAHHLPSLEPYEPRSGTTGVPSASFTPQFARALFPGPPPIPEAVEDHQPQIMDEKIELAELIQSIEGVMRGYNGYQSRSLVYREVLREFMARALDLEMLISPRSGDADQMCPHYQTSLSPSVSPLGSPDNSPNPPEPGSPTCAALQQLLDEWWTSEVAAAWYGPAHRRRSGESVKAAASPSTTPISPRSPGTSQNKLLRRATDERTGKHRNESQAVHSTSKRDHSRGAARTDKTDRYGERVEAIKRDLSHVGLNDD